MIPKHGTKQFSSVSMSPLGKTKSNFGHSTYGKLFFSRPADMYIIDKMFLNCKIWKSFQQYFLKLHFLLIALLTNLKKNYWINKSSLFFSGKTFSTAVLFPIIFLAACEIKMNHAKSKQNLKGRGRAVEERRWAWTVVTKNFSSQSVSSAGQTHVAAVWYLGMRLWKRERPKSSCKAWNIDKYSADN